MGHTPCQHCQPSTMGGRIKRKKPVSGGLPRPQGHLRGSLARHGHGVGYRMGDRGTVTQLRKKGVRVSSWPVQLSISLGDWTGGTTTWAMTCRSAFLCVHPAMVTRSVAVAGSRGIAGSVARSVAVARSGIDAHHESQTGSETWDRSQWT